MQTPKRDGRRALALFAICGGAFLQFLDATIVNTAFPDIRSSFHGAAPDELVWILDAYFIATAALLVAAGGIADALGRRRVFISGTIAFGFASVLCAAAPTWETLTAARVLQGLAGALLVPASLGLLLQLYRPEERSTGIGIWGAAAAFAAAIGPPLGGGLVALAGWRLIFLVNVPLVLLVVWASRVALRESREPDAPGVPDLGGSLYIAVGLGLTALALVRAQTWGWVSAPTLGSFAVAAASLLLAVRRSRRHDRPAFDLTLLQIRSFRDGSVGNLVFATGFFAMLLANVLFLTGVWHYSELKAGCAIIPTPLVATLIARAAGRAADRTSHRVVIIPGAIIYAAGLLVLRMAGPEPAYVAEWLPGQLLMGVGLGLAFATYGAAAAAEVPARQFASAMAATAAARQVGAVLGTALLVAILGTPHTVARTLAVFDRAYLFGAATVLLSGVIALSLRPIRTAHEHHALAASSTAAAAPVATITTFPLGEAAIRASAREHTVSAFEPVELRVIASPPTEVG